jgi:predicted phosphodiesterase
MVRFAVLSDLHANLVALEAVLCDIQAQGVPDIYWVLGDLVSHGAWPSETIARLRALPNASFIQGNADRYVSTGRRPHIPVRSCRDWARMPAMLAISDANFRWTVERLSYADFEFLRDLPTQLGADIPGYGRIVAVHAAPGDDEIKLSPDITEKRVRRYLDDLDARLLFFGHTHQPADWTVDCTRLVNVGSVGLPLDGDPRAAYARIDFKDGTCELVLRRVPYDIEAVVDELERRRFPAWAQIASTMR